MTLTLVLMRHAKSDWTDPLLSDHDRVLNERGKRSAKAIGKWLREIEIAPSEVLSSSAARTVETYQRLGLEAPITLCPDLYLASPDTMLRRLQKATAPCVLMLGHNPGIAELASSLLMIRPAHGRFLDYPTCSTLVARFDITSWTDLRFHSGTSTHFVVPADIL